jgi:hypothetical protein
MDRLGTTHFLRGNGLLIDPLEDLPPASERTDAILHVGEQGQCRVGLGRSYPGGRRAGRSQHFCPGLMAEHP